MKIKQLRVSFMIDTGCSENMINGRLLEQVKTCSTNEKKMFNSMNDSNESIGIDIQFKLEKTVYTERFWTVDCSHPIFQDNNFPVLGIIGTKFLYEKRSVIDYSILMTDVPENEYREQEYSSPFKFGLINYGIPAIGIDNGNDKNVMIALVDTGSNINIICEKSLEGYGLEHLKNDEKDEVYDIGSCIESQIETISFKLVTLSREGNLSSLGFKTDFHVIAGKEYITAEENDEVPPIEGIVGGLFLLENGCIIDFRKATMTSKKW